MRRAARLLLACGLVLGSAATVDGAASAPGAAPLRGFTPDWAGRAAAAEAFLEREITAPQVGGLAESLASQPAIAGTESMVRASKWLRQTLEGWGLRTEVFEYEVFLPHVARAELARVSPAPLVLGLDELPLTQDADAADSHYGAAAGYSASGDVTAGVVYANYGSSEDFAHLRALGVETRGRIALIRYGELFRGAKVANAEEAGAAAVVLYSDPADDGYSNGAVYPAGPFRPASGIQRGSVRVGAPGDPTTPGWPSVSGAARSTARLPTVPVVTAGYEAAAELLGRLDGAVAPAQWQGGLPHAYRTGAGRLVARVKVELQAKSLRRVFNTVAYLPGGRLPDEWVIVGAHRDSWTNGALDNASGTASVLAAARALARLAESGTAPARTTVFAFWDAEEWGLIGSAEWVEEHDRLLRSGAVAYLNQDGVAGGPYFDAVASPSLRQLLVEVADAVADPADPSISVLEGWSRRRPRDREVPPPGAGSDYASFAGRLGVPSMGFGFAGHHGVYHSAYDTSAFVRSFGDPGYRQHQSASRMTAIAAWRLANAQIVPVDLVGLASETRQRASRLARHLVGVRLSSAVDARALILASEELLSEARRVQAAATGELVAGTDDWRSLDRLNATVRAARGALSAEANANPGGSWFRNNIIAPDPIDAYRARWFPGLADALIARDSARLHMELERLTGQLRAAAALLAGHATAAPVP